MEPEPNEPSTKDQISKSDDGPAADLDADEGEPEIAPFQPHEKEPDDDGQHGYGYGYGYE